MSTIAVTSQNDENRIDKSELEQKYVIEMKEMQNKLYDKNIYSQNNTEKFNCNTNEAVANLYQTKTNLYYEIKREDNNLFKSLLSPQSSTTLTNTIINNHEIDVNLKDWTSRYHLSNFKFFK